MPLKVNLVIMLMFVKVEIHFAVCFLHFLVDSMC